MSLYVRGEGDEPLANDTKIRASFLHAYLTNDRSTGLAAAAATVAFLLCAVRTEHPAFAVLTVVQPLLHALRVVYLHRAYRDEIARLPDGEPLRIERIVYWERAATAFGGALFVSIAAGCVVAFGATADAFTQLLCLCLTLANALGIVGRSYAMKRLVQVQLLALCGPWAVAMLLSGAPWVWTIAFFSIPFAIVVVDLTVRLRGDLVTVVRERETARRTAARFSATLAAIPDLVIHLNADGRARVANAAARRLLPELGSTGTRFLDAVRANSIFSSSDVHDLDDLIAGATARPRSQTFRTGDGRILDAVASRENGTDTLVVLSDVTERERALAATVTMAREEHLTGLMSRAWFMENAARLLQERGEHVPTLVVFDIDAFKSLNDTQGHQAGDAALRVFASLLSAACDERTIATRHGGDEFALLSVGDAPHREAFLIDVSGIVSEFARRFLNAPVRLKVSAGVSSAADTIDGLFATADLALQEAQRPGQEARGGGIYVYDERLRERTERRERMKVLLAAAIETGEGIHAVYQPIVDPLRARVVGAEALCRWSHPELGTVPPPVFIALAEELGAIRRLTDIVLGDAVRQCALWPGHMSVSVNLAASDLEGGDLLARVRRALARGGLPPERLQLEITETRAIRHDQETRATLDALVEEGIALALDDFGTGFSNLATVASLPLRTLKIDRSLVASIAEGRRFLLLSGAVTMFARMGFRIVVEGIETEDQLDRLASIDAPALVQGYLFGRPMSAAELGAFAHRGFDRGPPRAASAR